MTEWLIRRFVKNPDDIRNKETRYSYGILTSVTGIACNVVLFLLKLAGGTIMHSISILSDSFNNLSDCFSGLISLFGYKAAAKPADREHPFGHGRMEYIISLAIAAMIFIAAFELLKASIERIMDPVKIEFDVLLFAFVVFTVPVKFWLSRMNAVIGERIASMPMKAVAEDAKNDVFATLISLSGMILSAFYEGFPFDGAAGVILSLMIFRSGWEMASDIVTKLLGSPSDPELIRKIENIILKQPQIRGVHDVILHEYGPGRVIGSAHAEIDGTMEFIKVHAAVDRAEKMIRDNLQIEMTIHADPYTESTESLQEEVLECLRNIDPALSLHDFRTYGQDGKTCMDFDIAIPFGSGTEQEEILRHLKETFGDSYLFEITFDHISAGEQG